MNEIDCADQKHIFRGELALLLVIIMNSFGVVLMLYSGSGISAISSVPYAFSEVFPFLSLGTWTYIFQAILIASLMILRKHFVIEYLLSFVVGFAFSMMLDVHKGWISILPYNIPMRIIYFCIATCCSALELHSPTAVDFQSFRQISFRESYPPSKTLNIQK